ncbi:hypothetical protein G9A89_006100 [Geosiphon pyriformis]|nr:hypothetical protein G9A89_006100 [Geosiphon pyriformis]
MTYLILNNFLVTIAVVIIVVVLIVVVTLSFVKKKIRNDTFLILGLSDAGKTALYAMLRYGELVSTHTSMKENEGHFIPTTFIVDEFEPLTKEPVHIVDVPGHERLRFKFLEFVPITRGIIFVIDSASCVKNYRPIAEYLYDIFSNKHVSKQKVPVLILCNKNDLVTALSSEKIQTSLEIELTHLRGTRTAALEHQDSAEEVEFLGYENEDFKFDHLENRVEFVSLSVEKGQINMVKEWIADVFTGY